jgi:signal transduction histidine kinase
VPPATPSDPSNAVADHVARLQQLTEAVSSAVTMRDVARALFEQGLEQLGARAVGIVWMVRPGKLELVFGHGVSEEEFRALDAAAHAGERLPVHDAVVGRRSVWLETPEEIRERYPVLEPLRARRGESGCAIVPLVVGDRCPGVIGFTFDRPHPFSATERSFVEALAKVSAQAFERARLFEAEQEARREAERVRDLQHRLMAIVGHDLRTPLGAILLSAGALTARGDLTPQQAKVVDRIATSAGRMNAIIGDLLDFGRARQGMGFALRLERVDLGEVARRAIAELTAGGRRPVALRVEGDPALDGDPARLAQVASNLIGNALEHGGAGEVSVRVDGRGPDVRLAVHNEGPPIPPELLPHVFEPFRRGDDDRRAGGTGLGLFIVREIVVAHGGTATASSDAAGGTTLTVRLPRRRAR